MYYFEFFLRVFMGFFDVVTAAGLGLFVVGSALFADNNSIYITAAVGLAFRFHQ